MPDIRITLDDNLHAKLKASAALAQPRQSIIALVRKIIREHIEREARK
jgi:plasmid stability protein